MTHSNDALAGMRRYPQFILYKKVPGPDKIRKIPLNPHTRTTFAKGANWQDDPACWCDFATADKAAKALGADYGVGFLFTASDPYWFLDIDNCLVGGAWSHLAMQLVNQLAGSAVEVSTSGQGLHLFGTGTVPEHSCRNDALGLEFYTQRRFVALGDNPANGDCDVDLTAQVSALCAQYFPVKAGQGVSAEWTTAPHPTWRGPESDDELLDRALNARDSAAAAFGHKATFSDLWHAKTDALAATYPDSGGREYDASTVDAALAQHLAFWCGNDCERIWRLMHRSMLVREKWGREDYLERTILRAVSLQDVFYSVGPDLAGVKIADSLGAPDLRSSSVKQREFAERVRSEKLAQATQEEAEQLCQDTASQGEANFWLTNKDLTATQLAQLCEPVKQVSPVISNEISRVSGYQFLSADMQIEHFKGCVYVQEAHKVFTPTGAMLKPGQFNATYGGYAFQLNEEGKASTEAFKVFTESQLVRWPKVEATCFRPEQEPGALIEEEGRILVNTYVPIPISSHPGDVTPFLSHLARLLPDPRDQVILLSYMAACVQHRGTKFQWAPLIQGTEGNGKTLFTRCVAYACGARYTHLPPANELSEKFNEWLFGKLFIGIEDVYVPEHKREVIEVLKPMITNERLSKRGMQAAQVTEDNRANFMLNSNYKDGVRKTENDRRFCPFYCAQQSEADIVRDGMSGNYFPDLYAWLNNGGYAAVAHYLEHYQIADELNPAKLCHRAPRTSSTDEAIQAGLGRVEQEILEAVDESRPGFAGGWISSLAVDRLLKEINAEKSIPRNKRRGLLQSLGYDWHPALKDGRVNNLVTIDNGKPRLFIKSGHISANAGSAAEVVQAYTKAQGGQPGAPKSVPNFS